jgi:putative YhbY family RNA-binding protein
MIELSPQQRRAFRAKAHHLHPVVTIGHHGLTPTVLTEIDLALNAHGLIKVRVFIDDREEREALLAEIAEGLEAAPVQHIGKLLVLWRPQPEPEPTPVPVRAARPKRGKPPAAKAPASGERAAKPFAPAGRRARGQPGPAKPGGVEGKSRGNVPGDRRGMIEPPVKPQASTSRSRTRLDRDRHGESAPAAVRAPRGRSAPNPRRRRGVQGR